MAQICYTYIHLIGTEHPLCARHCKAVGLTPCAHVIYMNTYIKCVYVKFTYIDVQILHATGRDSDKQVTHLYSLLAMLYFISQISTNVPYAWALGATSRDFSIHMNC